MSIKGLTKEENVAFVAVAKRLAQAELAANPVPPTEEEIIQAKQKILDQQLKQFKQFDDARLGKLSLVAKNKRQELIEAMGWTPEMGDCELHFRDKLPGNRCAWSVKWAFYSGTILPRDYFPLEQMSAAGLLLEAHDLCHQKRSSYYRGPDPAVIKREILPIVQRHEAGGSVNLVELRRLIKIQREQYTTHGGVNTREGWGHFKGLPEKELA